MIKDLNWIEDIEFDTEVLTDSFHKCDADKCENKVTVRISSFFSGDVLFLCADHEEDFIKDPKKWIVPEPEE